ncbi:MAG: hypothetical protein V4538_00250 [Bacteroidota bacterium]
MEATFKRLMELFPTEATEIENVDNAYPLISTTVVPLSFTGVNARTFYAWKENGLVDLTIMKKQDETGRVWIKLNLYEFVWIKIVQCMRDFGLSYDHIKIVKDRFEIKTYMEIVNNLDEMENMWRNHLHFSEEKVQELRDVFQKLSDIMCTVYDENDPYEQQKTVLFNMIITTMMKQAKSSILLLKEKDGFRSDIMFYNGIEDIDSRMFKNIRKPHFEIPLLEIIEEFFDQPKSEEYGMQLGLFNPKEKRVLDALKKNDFKELHIKIDDKNDFIIEAIEEGNITDEQAAQVRKMLGLGNYQSINLKFRNEKNLYFKKTRRVE